MDRTTLADYKYHDELGLELPLLIVGIHQSEDYPMEFTPKKKYKNRFVKLVHQTAGHGCHHDYIYGIVLKQREYIKKDIKALCDKYYESDLGCLYTPLSELANYNNTICNNMYVDCNHSYHYLKEAIYPVDYHYETMEALVDPADLKTLPKEINHTLAFRSKLDDIIGSIGRWNIFILGENCD